MLHTGLGAGFTVGWPGTQGTNAGIPQGPTTAAGKGFGTTAGDSGGMDGKTVGVLSVGTFALVALVWIWWALPR